MILYNLQLDETLIMREQEKEHEQRMRSYDFRKYQKIRPKLVINHIYQKNCQKLVFYPKTVSNRKKLS